MNNNSFNFISTYISYFPVTCFHLICHTFLKSLSFARKVYSHAKRELTSVSSLTFPLSNLWHLPLFMNIFNFFTSFFKLSSKLTYLPIILKKKLPSHPCNYSLKINNSYIAYNYKIVLVRKEQGIYIGKDVPLHA